MLLSICPVGCLSLVFLNYDSQQDRDRATSGCNKKNLIGPILFLYDKESLVLSNLNSNLLRFHCVRPTVHTYYVYIMNHIPKFSLYIKWVHKHLIIINLYWHFSMVLKIKCSKSKHYTDEFYIMFYRKVQIVRKIRLNKTWSKETFILLLIIRILPYYT